MCSPARLDEVDSAYETQTGMSTEGRTELGVAELEARASATVVGTARVHRRMDVSNGSP